MRRSVRYVGAGALAALLALSGCDGGGPPSVASSTEETTVHGTVKYKGNPVNEGEVVFDPRNINRKSASMAVGAIGKDGSYSVKTLVGDNSVSFKLPTLGKQDPSIGYATFQYDAPKGDSTKDFDLPIAP